MDKRLPLKSHRDEEDLVIGRPGSHDDVQPACRIDGLGTEDKLRYLRRRCAPLRNFARFGERTIPFRHSRHPGPLALRVLLPGPFAPLPTI